MDEAGSLRHSPATDRKAADRREEIDESLEVDGLVRSARDCSLQRRT
jgi:hypothetical protein